MESNINPQLQRDISILVRFPRFALMAGEDDQEKISEMQERLEWEAAALRRSGGYRIKENNIFVPGDGARRLGQSSERLSWKNLCPHHSIGERSHFLKATTATKKAITDCIQSFTAFEEMKQMSQNENLGLGHRIFRMQIAIQKAQDCLENGKEVHAPGEEVLDCQACRVSSVLSTVETLQALVFLSQVTHKSQLQAILIAIFAQVIMILPSYTLDYAVRLEQKLLVLAEPSSLQLHTETPSERSQTPSSTRSTRQRAKPTRSNEKGEPPASTSSAAPSSTANPPSRSQATTTQATKIVVKIPPSPKDK